MTTRLPDWEDRLGALIAERRDVSFGWGTHDCALWGADIVEALTGVDHGAPFRGKYDDAEGAARALRDFGQGTIVRTFDAVLKRCPLALLQRGDIAMIGSGIKGVSVGGVIGGDALFIGDLGLERRAVRDCTRGWKVD